jgi:hypothetical protein
MACHSLSMLFSIATVLFSLSNEALAQSGATKAAIINPKSIPGLPFKQLTQEEIDKFLSEPKEIRMFVPVPFDPFGVCAKLGINGCPKTIHLEVRIVPQGAVDGTLPANWKSDPKIYASVRESIKTLLDDIIFGGPGYATKNTIAYEWSNGKENPEKAKKIKIYRRNKLVAQMFIGQRLSPFGISAGLDTEKLTADMREVDYDLVAHFVNFRVMAHDHAMALRWLENQGVIKLKNTMITGHSAGATIAESLVALQEAGKIAPLNPKSLTLASGGGGWRNAAQEWINTRTNVIAYNRRVERWSKNPKNAAITNGVAFSEIIMRTRALLSSKGMDPDVISNLYGYFFPSPHEEQSIYENAKTFLSDLENPEKSVAEVVDAFTRDNSDRYNPITQIFMSQLFGYNSAGKLQSMMKPMPEAWMIGPVDGMAQEQKPHREKIEKTLPSLKATYPPTTAEQMISYSKKNRLILQDGQKDLVSDAKATMENLEKLNEAGGRIVEVLTSGVHRDIYLPEGIVKTLEAAGVVLTCEQILSL